MLENLPISCMILFIFALLLFYFAPLKKSRTLHSIEYALILYTKRICFLKAFQVFLQQSIFY